MGDVRILYAIALARGVEGLFGKLLEYVRARAWRLSVEKLRNVFDLASDAYWYIYFDWYELWFRVDTLLKIKPRQRF